MTNYHLISFCRKIQVKKQSASLKVITVRVDLDNPDPTYSHHIERILKNVYEKEIIPVEQLGNCLGARQYAQYSYHQKHFYPTKCKRTVYH